MRPHLLLLPTAKKALSGIKYGYPPVPCTTHLLFHLIRPALVPRTPLTQKISPRSQTHFRLRSFHHANKNTNKNTKKNTNKNTKTITTTMAIAKDNVSQLLTMFPERPSGVSWADWVDDDDDDDGGDDLGPVPFEPAPVVVQEPAPKKTAQEKRAAVQSKKPVQQKKVLDPRKLAEINKTLGPRKAAAPPTKKQQEPKPEEPTPPPAKDQHKPDDRIIETHLHQKIIFDTAVPKPILLNPSMKPNELGLGASRWASAAEPGQEAEEKAVSDNDEQRPEAPPPTTTKTTQPPARRPETPSSPATKPEPVEPATLAPAPAAVRTRPASPPPKPLSKAAEPGLMASRWAS